MFAPTKTIAPDSLISLISEEFERQKTQKSRRSGKTKEDDKDEAMAVGSSSKGKGKFPRGVCWNCGEKGHYKDKCPKPAKVTKDPKKEAEPKKSDSANVVESDSESEAAFMMSSDSESVKSEADDLDFEEGDWFSEVEEDELESNDSDDSDINSLENSSSSDIFEAMELANPGHHTYTRAELYDSGCTKHISPYRDDLIDFAEIPPKSFRAANKQSFSATGIGKLIVDLPNGVRSSKLELTEVQYSSQVAYTLVSVGNLDEKGYTVKFGGGKCVITDRNGAIVGEVPKNHRGLYRVEHDLETADVVSEELTLEQFHRRMGHISPEIARKLVSQGLVTGVHLETTDSGNLFFCESCIYAKSSRKPIQKVRGGERATEFGGEVHSDLWGPAPVESRGGKRYYITFTDDKTRLTHLYLLRKKDEAFNSYKDYEAWVNTQLSAKIKTLHSDRGGEYKGKEFIVHLKSKGTTSKFTVHDTCYDFR